MRRAIAGVPLVLLTAAAMAGCDAITGSKKPKVEVTPSTSTASVAQGANTTITLAIKRTKFDKPVAITVEGAPQGITALVTPSSVQNGTNSASLQISAAASAVPGKTTLTLRVKAEGLEDQTIPVDVTVSPTGGFTLSSIDPSLSVAVGGGGTSTLRVARTGGNGANVDLAASGLPSGMTASFVTAPTTSSIATMILAASSSVAPGTYTITVTATSPGFSNQTTTVSVTVNPAPAMATLSLGFCLTDFPVWVAYQNEGFAWQQATPTGTGFSFQATDRLGLVLVFQSGGASAADIYYATRAELASFTDRDCGGSKNFTGSVAGLGAGQTAKITMGVAQATTTSASFSLNSVHTRTLDLVGVSGTFNGNLFTTDKVIVRRSLDLAAGATIPALDFSSGEAVAAASNALSITDVQTADSLEITNTFWSKTSTFSTVNTLAMRGSSATIKSVPAALMVAGDTHELFIDAFQLSSSQVVGRSYVRYSSSPADFTAALGPPQNTPTMSFLTSTPYTRVRGVVAAQPEYSTSIQFGYFQGQGTSSRLVNVSKTAAYLGGTPATWNVEIPDFNGTPSFNANWMPTSANPITFYVEGFSGREDLILGALPAAGDQVRLAYYVAPLSITTLLRDAPSHERLVRPQYLRR